MAGSKKERVARATGPVRRSGRWLIAGTLIFAAAVLAWAFGVQAPAVTHVRRPSATVSRPTSRAGATRARPARTAAPAHKVVIASRPPDIASYSPLLGHDVFRPLVVPPKPGHAAAASRTATGTVPILPDAAHSEARDDTWRGWRFNGVAQLSGETYALVEQQDKGRSFFLKAGDRLEDAKVLRVETQKLVLAEAGGGVTRVPRVDAMAELLRATRARSGAAGRPVTAPAGAGAAPGAPAAPGTSTAPGQTVPPAGAGILNTQSAPAAVPDGFDGRRERRQRQQSPGTPGEGSGTNANPNIAP